MCMTFPRYAQESGAPGARLISQYHTCCRALTAIYSECHGVQLTALNYESEVLDLR